jgi:Tfp pilus assembly protein PilO
MWHKYMMRLLVLVLAGLAGYGAWWLYDFGKLQGAEELKAMRAEHADLRRHYQDLHKESKALRERNTILERSSQIDQQAAKDLPCRKSCRRRAKRWSSIEE